MEINEQLANLRKRRDSLRRIESELVDIHLWFEENESHLGDCPSGFSELESAVDEVSFFASELESVIEDLEHELENE